MEVQRAFMPSLAGSGCQGMGATKDAISLGIGQQSIRECHAVATKTATDLASATENLCVECHRRQLFADRLDKFSTICL